MNTFGKITFGGCIPKSVPEGWDVISTPDDWLQIKSPENKTYLIGENILIPYQQYDGFSIENTALKKGEWFADDRNIIPFPDGLVI